MNEIIIDHKKQLNISLSTNININTLPCICTWTTIGSTAYNIFRTTLSDNIPKIIIPTPTINHNRQLNYLKINNNDNISVIVLINISSTDIVDYNMNIVSVLLSPNDILFYNIKDGFYIIDYNGIIKNIQNNVEITSTSIFTSGITNILDYYTKPEINSFLFNKSDAEHTHSTSESGVTVNDFNIYTGITNTNINNKLDRTDFNIYTGTTNSTYTKSAFGSLYEHTSGGTIISVSNAGYTGWISAISANHLLTTFTNDATADKITILNGGSGTYQVNVIVNAKFSSAVPIYHMGIFKNNILLTPLQSYVSPANATDRYNLSSNSQISGIVPGDFFDIRFNSDNATPRNITMYHITFNINRIGD